MFSLASLHIGEVLSSALSRTVPTVISLQAFLFLFPLTRTLLAQTFIWLTFSLPSYLYPKVTYSVPGALFLEPSSLPVIIQPPVMSCPQNILIPHVPSTHLSTTGFCPTLHRITKPMEASTSVLSLLDLQCLKQYLATNISHV